jgi:hypothetical protein
MRQNYYGFKTESSLLSSCQPYRAKGAEMAEGMDSWINGLLGEKYLSV